MRDISVQRGYALGLLSLVLALGTACSVPQYKHAVERRLAANYAPVATPDLACAGYLVWNNEPVRDVFLIMNGSGVLSNAFVHPTFEELIDDERVAYATFDKPGIYAPFGDPAAVHRDYARLEHYTLSQGVACATDALRWSRQQFGPAARLHLRGHSEGALIALYTYDALLSEDAELARGITDLMLSGLAVEPFGDILERQLAIIPKGAQIRRALSTCDWGALKTSLGISCAYVEDAKRRPSGRTLFEHLAARSAPARFYVFQGNSDWNTPSEPVHQLESWNKAQGHLALEVHYYDGAHGGTDAVRAEMVRRQRQLIAP